MNLLVFFSRLGPYLELIVLDGPLGMDGSGLDVRYDAKHHPMAMWDDHPACRTCMKQSGIHCSEESPCNVCRRWPPALWAKVRACERKAHARRLQRARARMETEVAKYRELASVKPISGTAGLDTAAKASSAVPGSRTRERSSSRIRAPVLESEPPARGARPSAKAEASKATTASRSSAHPTFADVVAGVVRPSATSVRAAQAKAGKPAKVMRTTDGTLVITRGVKTNGAGRSLVGPRVAREVPRGERSSRPVPPGFSGPPTAGAALANQAEAVTQVVMGKVTEMLAEFQRTFLASLGTAALPQEPAGQPSSASPSPVVTEVRADSGETGARVEDASSGEDARLPEAVCRSLPTEDVGDRSGPPRADGTSDRRVVFSGENEPLEIHLGPGEKASACRAPSPRPSTSPTRGRSRSRKSKKEKKKKKKRRHRRHSSSSSSPGGKVRRTGFDQSADETEVRPGPASVVHAPALPSALSQAVPETRDWQAGCLDDGLPATVGEASPMEVDQAVDPLPGDEPTCSVGPAVADVVAGDQISVCDPAPSASVAPSEQLAAQLGREVADLSAYLVPSGSRPIRLVRQGRPVSPIPATEALAGALPAETAEAWSELTEQFAATSGEAAAGPTSLGELTLPDDQMELDDSRLEDLLLGEGSDLGDCSNLDDFLSGELSDFSDENSDGERTGRRFSRLAGEREVQARPLLSLATLAKESAQAQVKARKADGSSEPSADRPDEPGTVFRANVAVMRETLPEAAVPQSAPAPLRAAPMSAKVMEALPKVEVPFSPYVGQKFAELSAELAGTAEGTEGGPSGEGLARNKLLAKPKSKLDLYRVARPMYSFAPAVVDQALRDREVREPASISVASSTLHRLEQDARILTLVGSFLDCSGRTATDLLEEASRDPATPASTKQLVDTLLDLERSRGRAVGHVLSGSVTMDANLKLLRRDAILSAASLPAGVARDAYQLPLDPSGAQVFGGGLSELLGKADKIAADKRHRSLEEAMVKTARAGKAPAPARPSTSTGGGQRSQQQTKPQRKRKRAHKKGGQPSKGPSSHKGGGKADARP